MKKNNLKNIAVISLIMGIGLLTIYLLSRDLFLGLSLFSFVGGFLFCIIGLICLYKFITFGKTYRWYRVINDIRNSHGMVNTYCRYVWTTGDGRFGVRDTKTGKLYLCEEKDVVNATAEYITKKIENAVIFFAGFTALIITGANAFNEGHWFGTVGFAIISFVCFTVFKIENEKY